MGGSRVRPIPPNKPAGAKVKLEGSQFKSGRNSLRDCAKQAKETFLKSFLGSLSYKGPVVHERRVLVGCALHRSNSRARHHPAASTTAALPDVLSL